MNIYLWSLMKAEWQAIWWHWLLYGVLFLAPAVIGAMILPVMQQPEVDVTLTLSKLPRALVVIEMIQFTYIFLIGLWIITAVTTVTMAEAKNQGALAYLLDRPVPRWQVLCAKWLMLSIPACAVAWLSIPITMTVLYGVMIWLLPDATMANTLDAYVSALSGAFPSIPMVVGVAAFAVANALLWSTRTDRTGLVFIASLTTLVTGLFITDNQMSIGIMGFWLPISTPQVTEADIFAVQPFRTGAALILTACCLYGGQWVLRRREWGE